MQATVALTAPYLMWVAGNDFDHEKEKVLARKAFSWDVAAVLTPLAASIPPQTPWEI